MFLGLVLFRPQDTGIFNKCLKDLSLWLKSQREISSLTFNTSRDFHNHFLYLLPQYDNHDFNGHMLKDGDNQDVSAVIQFGHVFISTGSQCWWLLFPVLLLCTNN